MHLNKKERKALLYLVLLRLLFPPKKQGKVKKEAAPCATMTS